MKIGREISFQSWIFSDSLFLKCQPLCHSALYQSFSFSWNRYIIVQSIIETFYCLASDDLLPLQTFPFSCIYNHETHICFVENLVQSPIVTPIQSKPSVCDFFVYSDNLQSRLFSVRWYCLFFWSLRGGDRTYHMGILLYHLQRGSCQHQSTKVGKIYIFVLYIDKIIYHHCLVLWNLFLPIFDPWLWLSNASLYDISFFCSCFCCYFCFSTFVLRTQSVW